MFRGAVFSCFADRAHAVTARTFPGAKKLNTTSTASAAEVPGPASSGPQLVRRPEPDVAEIFPWLPCTLTVELPVVKFTVRDLMKLSPGSVVETAFHQSSDLPLRVNGQLVGWTEFEVVGERLAVRLTDLT